ncbi:MAG: prepilin-type N-terminal cleavage/methylation domain-containing protein [Proteobacteria bacterium]|nr:prepilin-type N-terminal cleavage/methylation domain-containing protein [Pseudomonadota bacterium]
MASSSPPSASRLRNAGFTLIEAVMVIVITGVIAGVVAVFIVSPVKGYADSVRRAEMTDTADVVMRRFAREIHLALPNSLRVKDSSGNNGSCAAQPSVTCYIEFIPTAGGGRYRNSTDGSTGGNFLSFTSAILTFDVMGPLPGNPYSIAPGIFAGDYIVVYNLGPGYAPGDAYASGDPCSTCNRAKVASVDAVNRRITLVSNPFASQSPSLSSPNNAFQVVPGGTRAVTYACPTVTPGNLTRYWNYGFNTNLSTTPSGTSAILASNISCVVAPYSATNSASKGLLSITITLTDPTSNESATLFRQIHVDNLP